MTIVRSLLVSIGFQSDNSGIKKTEKNILGMTARIGASFTVLKFFAKRVVGFFSDIADSIINTSFLAKRLGVDLKDIASIESAGIEFGVDKKQVQSFLTTTQKLLDDQRLGVNSDLQNLARVRGFEISTSDNAISILFKYLQALNKISNEQDKIRIAGLTFGKESGNFISELSKNIDDFKRIFEENKLKDGVLGDDKKAVDFKKSLDRLSLAIEELTFIFSDVFFPLIEDLLKGLSLFIKSTKSEVTPFVNFFNKFQKLSDEEGAFNAFNRITGFMTPSTDRNFSPQITVNNEITVSDLTAKNIAEISVEGFDQEFNKNLNNFFKQLANDNPLVER